MSDLLTKFEKEKENGSAKDDSSTIECPRCHDIMTFDRLGYFCEECDLILRSSLVEF